MIVTKKYDGRTVKIYCDFRDGECWLYECPPELEEARGEIEAWIEDHQGEFLGEARQEMIEQRAEAAREDLQLSRQPRLPTKNGEKYGAQIGWIQSRNCERQEA